MDGRTSRQQPPGKASITTPTPPNAHLVAEGRHDLACDAGHAVAEVDLHHAVHAAVDVLLAAGVQHALVGLTVQPPDVQLSEAICRARRAARMPALLRERLLVVAAPLLEAVEPSMKLRTMALHT